MIDYLKAIEAGQEIEREGCAQAMEAQAEKYRADKEGEAPMKQTVLEVTALVYEQAARIIRGRN